MRSKQDRNTIIRYVTFNFTPGKIFPAGSYDEFKKYVTDLKEAGHIVTYDSRNNIYCVDPSNDVVMYYNYIKYLNSRAREWKNFGYMDTGMVPYFMWPSFSDSSEVMEDFRQITNKVGVSLHSSPTVSLLSESYNGFGRDYWIFREDLFKLAMAMQFSDSRIRFDNVNPDEASMEWFLKGLCTAMNGGV